MTVTHSAGFDRSLALTMFRRLQMGTLVPAAFSAMFGGRRLAKYREIIQLADLDTVTLLANRGPFPWQVDGDYLGEVERLDVRYEPDSLTLVIPGAAPGRRPGRR